jgi:hypothetical protein
VLLITGKQDTGNTTEKITLDEPGFTARSAYIAIATIIPQTTYFTVMKEGSEFTKGAMSMLASHPPFARMNLVVRISSAIIIAMHPAMIQKCLFKM